MEKTTIKELINLLEQELIRIGYKESTLHYYRENWKRLIAYFDERGEQFFSEKTAMQYVDEKCDFFTYIVELNDRKVEEIWFSTQVN